MEIIQENVLGIILRVFYNFEKPKDGFIKLVFNKSDIGFEESLGFSSLGTLNLLNYKVTLSARTIILAKSEDILKHHISKMALRPGRNYLAYGGRWLKAKEELTRLRKKYDDDKALEYKDLNRIRVFPEIEETLVYQIIFSSDEIIKLKSYLKKYYFQYESKELKGQERWVLPNVLANQILSIINNPQFIKTYGIKNILLESSKIAAFCHSIFYLERQNQIKLLELRKSYIGQQDGTFKMVWEAIINNTSRGLDVTNTNDPQKKGINPVQENIIVRCGKIAVIQKTANTVILSYEEGKLISDPISRNSAWFKVFLDYLENTRLTKNEIRTRWNTAAKNKFKNKRKVRDDNSYISKINQQVISGINGCSPEIAKKVEINPCQNSFKGSYVLNMI